MLPWRAGREAPRGKDGGFSGRRGGGKPGRAVSHELFGRKPHAIRRLLEHNPYSAAQILNRLHEAGYDGGATIVKDYLQRVRPTRAPTFLTLYFAPAFVARCHFLAELAE